MPKVLALTANPDDSGKLRLDAEIRDIRNRLVDAPNFRLEHRGATRAADLLRLLQMEEPDILHFSDHGGLGGGARGFIALEHEHGNARPVKAATLKRMMGQLQKKPRLVVLNCCYSQSQAKALAEHIDVVVGAKGALADELAIQFAEGLYEYLGCGESVGRAFELAKTQVILAGGDPRQFAISCRRRHSDRMTSFDGRPEIMAAFNTGPRGRPVKSADDEYRMVIWIRGASDFAESVVYQVCDESFEDDQYWEVTRAEDGQFKTYDFASYGQVTRRAIAWWEGGAVGTSSALTDALLRHYGASPPRVVRTAIDDLQSY